MYESISDELFVKEFQILWQSIDIEKRNNFNDLIVNYFEGDRAEKIRNKLQERIVD